MSRLKPCIAVIALALASASPVRAVEPYYRVSGEGYIVVDLPGYHGRSTFSYDQVLKGTDLPEAEIGFDEVTFSVNGIAQPGDGYGRLNKFRPFGLLEYGNGDGPFHWGFREGEGVYFEANDVSCLFPADWENPVCAAGDHDWDWSSYVEVVPPFELTLAKSRVAGCTRTTGTVRLFEPAPPQGLVIYLADTLVSASIPATVTVAPGASTSRFTISTTPVGEIESGWIVANVSELPGLDTQARLEVRPIGPRALKLNPTSVVGGHSATATVTLECAAAPGPVTVELGTSDPWTAAPLSASDVVPQGTKTATFTIVTTPVGSKKTPTFTAISGSVIKTKSISVVSAASVAPTKLAFAPQAVNSESAPQSIVLFNKGVVGYVLDSVTVTGPQPKMFVQTHNCPLILPAGSSCTIEMRFAPFTPGKKVAQLNISTFAKDEPLVVKMTGTGI